MKTSTLKMLLASAFATTLGVATQASAVLITAAEEGGWTGSNNLNDSFTGAPADNIPSVVGPNLLTHFTTGGWFTNSAPKSTLTLLFFSETHDVPSDGTPVDFRIARLSQNNVEINADDSLPGETFPYVHILSFDAQFRIFDAANNVKFSDSPTGTVRQTETRNSQPCIGQDGSLNAAGSICDDIYTSIFNTAAPVNFQIGGVTYSFGSSFAFSPGIVIGADGRTYTPEGGNNFVDVLVTIRAVPVPEPGTLALLGLGLIGLGFTGRRNRTA